MSVNRKRKKQVLIRLTDEEHDLLLKRMSEAGIQSQAAYLRRMALTGYILRMDLSEVREILRLISNATSNINQIAARANETRSIYGDDVIKLHGEVADMRLQVSDALKVFMKVRKFLDL